MELADFILDYVRSNYGEHHIEKVKVEYGWDSVIYKINIFVGDKYSIYIDTEDSYEGSSYLYFKKGDIFFKKGNIYKNDVKICPFYIKIDKDTNKIDLYLLEKKLNIFLNKNVNIFSCTEDLDLLNIENFEILEDKVYTNKFISSTDYNNIIDDFLNVNIPFLKNLLIKTNTFIMGDYLIDIIENKFEMNDKNIITIYCSNEKKMKRVKKYLYNFVHIIRPSYKLYYRNFEFVLKYFDRKYNFSFPVSNTKYDGKKLIFAPETFYKITEIYNIKKYEDDYRLLLEKCKHHIKNEINIIGFIISNGLQIW